MPASWYQKEEKWLLWPYHQTQYTPTCIIRREIRRQAQPGRSRTMWMGNILQSGQDWAMWRQKGRHRTGTTGGKSLHPTRQWVELNDDYEHARRSEHWWHGLTLPQRAAIKSDVRPTGPAPTTTTTTRDIRRRTRSSVVLLTRKQQVTATVSATVNSIVAFGTSGSLPQRGVVVIARVTREGTRLGTLRWEQDIGNFKRDSIARTSVAVWTFLTTFDSRMRGDNPPYLHHEILSVLRRKLYCHFRVTQITIFRRCRLRRGVSTTNRWHVNIARLVTANWCC